LPAVREGDGCRCVQARPAAADLAGADRRRLPLRARRRGASRRDPGDARPRERHLQRRVRDVPDLLRGARTRDLLPAGLARLLPHARLRPRRDRLHELPRRRTGDGQVDDAWQADGRSARAGPRHLAAVPPGAGRRKDPDGPLHPSRHMIRAAVWTVLGVCVVLAARAVVYALAPWQTLAALRLEHQAGGPHLAAVLAVALAVAAVLAAAVLWLAVVAVRGVVFFGATSVAFALFESYLHWRAGLGWHGLRCLVGPVHRDAIPVLGALSLLAVAGHGAVEHLLGWARRLVALLA